MFQVHCGGTVDGGPLWTKGVSLDADNTPLFDRKFARQIQVNLKFLLNSDMRLNYLPIFGFLKLKTSRVKLKRI